MIIYTSYNNKTLLYNVFNFLNFKTVLYNEKENAVLLFVYVIPAVHLWYGIASKLLKAL